VVYVVVVGCGRGVGGVWAAAPHRTASREGRVDCPNEGETGAAAGTLARVDAARP
jgi:hypothetical protein